MITSKRTYPNYPQEYFGLSTDTKPTDTANGSIFFEMDTGEIFLFDEEESVWYQQ